MSIGVHYATSPFGQYSWEIIFSSWPDRVGIDWLNDKDELADLNAFIKAQRPREYDPATKSWHITDNTFRSLFSRLGADCFRCHDQPRQAPARPKQPDTHIVLEGKLRQLFALLRVTGADLSSCYKQAALKLHPDLHPGKGHEMTELNSLWQQYKAVKP